MVDFNFVSNVIVPLALLIWMHLMANAYLIVLLLITDIMQIQPIIYLIFNVYFVIFQLLTVAHAWIQQIAQIVAMGLIWNQIFNYA